MNGGMYLVGLSICIGYLQDRKKSLSGPIYKRFDNDGVNICLKDNPDSSFLKMACSRSELMKPKICKEKTMLMKPRFDNDRADICLKRYLDPSFLKMACSRSELMKPKICGEKNNAPESKGRVTAI
ncbi:hypothetical protein CKAN_00020000 [Cinnamomum micranthum f. kanehirae]|uniref:Uncharacterized protein n=1 Tax=Cinnamomum micranthum f. kanehirae TaxID=337451 RepID=A0A443N0E9_9MAGN|nr:hypothetical protein CKAN_00020000 [Cinnamomum micranthum f. kanehirae]